MSYPANPLRLKIIDRVVDVLKAIAAGDVYFYAAADVTKRVFTLDAVPGFPFYMIGAAESRMMEQAGERIYDEIFILSVKGWTDLEGDETATKLEKCIEDVRRAIMSDAVSSASGSLGSLGIGIDLSDLETDNGILGADGFGFFDQRFEVRSRWSY